MKTEALVDLLARSSGRVQPCAAGRRFQCMLVLAAAASAAVSLGLLGIRPDWGDAVHLPMFWGKVAFALATAVLAAAVLWRLVHPGMRLGAALAPVLVPTAALWVTALQDLALAPAGTRAALVLGTSWQHCLAAISMLSIPAFALALAAVRLLAPTRLRLTGAVAGLFAGGIAAAVFSLYCSEMAPAYVGVWYVVGMLVPAAAGWALGPRILRW